MKHSIFSCNETVDPFTKRLSSKRHGETFDTGLHILVIQMFKLDY